MSDILHRRRNGFVLAIVLLGALLRIAGAQGGLWLDEAWSAVQAHAVGSVGGVLFGINHDNNHHLNSLWMLLVGIDAPSPLIRALSIVTGTASIAVAAAIGARRGTGVSLVTAALFAVSPAMVTMGSEARGYAPMMLALLVAILLVDRWLDGEGRHPGRSLALCFFLGALSQLTILFGFCALVGWTALVRWRRDGMWPALRDTARLFAPSLAAILAVFAIIAIGALHGNGFHLGNYDPFSWVQFCHGYTELTQYTLGVPIVSVIWLVFPAALIVIARSFGVSKLPLHWLAIVGFPLALALLHAGNVAHPRYYLLVAVALLLLLGELLARAIAAGGWRRIIASGALLIIAVGSLVQDIDLARNRRGDTALAIAMLRQRSPSGAVVAIDRPTARAALEVGAAQARYHLQIVQDCTPSRFVLAERFRGELPPPALLRCGRRYITIASARAHGLSGTNWKLYAQFR